MSSIPLALTGAALLPMSTRAYPGTVAVNTNQAGRSVAERVAALPALTSQPNPFGKPAEWLVWSQLRALRCGGLVKIASEMDAASLKAAYQEGHNYRVHPDGLVEKLTGPDTGLCYGIDPRTGCCTCKRGQEVFLLRSEMSAACCGTACRCRHDHLRVMNGLSLSRLIEAARAAFEGDLE